MTNDEKPLLYVIIGATGSGRREVMADLLEGGLTGSENQVVVLAAETETPGEHDARLGEITRWRWDEDRIQADVPAGTTHVFFLMAGRENPVDQLEALKPWLDISNLALGRVICVVHCQLAEAHPELLAWYDACIHFSDVVLLNHRDGVGNKWLSDFRARYKDQFFPCIFEFVKGGRVKNPALVLEPEARRITHHFDEEVDWVIAGMQGETEEDLGDEETEVTATLAEDPYLQRHQGGRRVKVLPKIAAFLPPPA